jgi:hypothetical protein
MLPARVRQEEDRSKVQRRARLAIAHGGNGDDHKRKDEQREGGERC